MKALDTNVLVRHLTQDDPAQAKTASLFIAKHCFADAPGFINHIVLCELVWVLESAYGYEKATIADALDSILRTRQFRVEHADLARRALTDYRAQQADFADALIAAVNRENGYKETVTFDKKAAKLSGFTLLG